MIPEQLKREEFKFCLLKSKDKIPFEKDWQNKGYSFNSPKLLDHIKEGGNYGVIGGYGNLRIIDADNQEMVKRCYEVLNTFAVSSSRGVHFYILTEYNTNHKLINDFGEFRANNYQVVGGGSTHPSGIKYNIWLNKPIQYLPEDTIKAFLKPYLREELFITTNIKEEEEHLKDDSRSGLEYRKVLALIREGKTKEDIFKIMLAYSKWGGSNPSYRDFTYNKALKYVENVDKEEQIIKSEKKEIKEPLSEEETNKVREILLPIYTNIIDRLGYYCDIKEEHKKIIALWILGTHFHKSFPTYPYLFFNAPKGSGKTRLLNLISTLSNNGLLISNVKESSLFRNANNTTFCIDELDNIKSKEKQDLKELMHVAYKKGMKILRSRKVTLMGKEKYETEKFEAYCPIAMANIWGMDDVLGDRCITLILDKSINQLYTSKMELFSFDSVINSTQLLIADLKKNVEMYSYTQFATENIYVYWNDYITNFFTFCPSPSSFELKASIHLYISILLHNSTQLHNLYEKIRLSNITGRYLELFFPILILANFVSDELFKEILIVSKETTSEKMMDDIISSKDTSLVEFISQLKEDTFIVKELTESFRSFLEEEKEKFSWLTTQWLGIALKRNNLILAKKREGRGVIVKLDLDKAIKKSHMLGVDNKEKKEENQSTLLKEEKVE